MRIRSWLASLLVVTLVISIAGVAWANDSVPNTVTTAPPALQVQTPSALLMDAGTGTILFTKNEHDKRPIASMTKIMTMLLAMEAVDQGRVKLSDKVTTSRNASGMGGSTIFLETGETLPLEEMMTGIAVNSANDAAVAVAEFIAGSEEAFVELMNIRAKELGMTDTTFKNPHGLHEDGHISSAYDVAIMSRELLRHPKIHEWMTIWTGKTRNYNLENTNRLIHDYPGADGLKTGFVEESLHCVSATAKRNDLRLVAVLIAAPTSAVRWNEATKMLDWGFANYGALPIVERSQVVQRVKVEKGIRQDLDLLAEDSLSLLFGKGKEPKTSIRYEMYPRISAPIKQGQHLGEMVVIDENKIELARVSLLASQSVDRIGILGMMARCWQTLFYFKTKVR
ncbi:MAG: D-alanyl-D-alanine carboxypeptidase family protein [Bacillota bacterium]